MKNLRFLLGACLLFGVAHPCNPWSGLRAAPPPLFIQSRDDNSVQLSWTNTPGILVLEETDALSPTTLWHPFSQNPTLSNEEFFVVVDFTSDSRFFRLRETPTDGLPPDPATLAPPPANGVVTILGFATSFLYTGTNAVQSGVIPGTIELKRAAVIRGRVKQRDGTVLSGVVVTILNHPEFGSALTRADGRFDMAVNGGGPLMLNYEKTGVCPVQRQLNVPWQDYVTAPDVVMVPMDLVVTAITFGTNSQFQTAESSLQTDADGVRHTLMLFNPGTTADLVLTNGTTQKASSLHIRATEFTVSANGPKSMPALLPPLSGYTYCVELSADEAMSGGATGVIFSQPIITYVENFLDFPVGLDVPVGIYDRVKAVWVPSANGRVVRIIGINGGLADVDTDGDEVADAALGITTEERRSLASAYPVGQTLWRVGVTHFSPEDSNWPFTRPSDAKSPGNSGAGLNNDVAPDNPKQSCGCIIENENQVLGEFVPIVGTPFSLNYRSDRVPGQVATRTIRLSGPEVPASLASIGLHVSVAGRDFDQEFSASPNQQTTFAWDRIDAYGRPSIGGQTMNVTIDYNYPTQYQEPGPFPSAFNNPGGPVLSANPGRQQISISDRFTTTIGEGLTDARTIGLGGWALNVHYVFDPVARVMHGGNGLRRRAGSVARILTTIDLPGRSVLFDVAVGPDGSQYVALPHGDLVVRIAPDGSQSIVAGNGTEGFNGDGIPAINAELGDPTGIVVAPDGSLYIAEESNNRIRRVAPDGIISTVAGNGVAGFGGDGGPATQALLQRPGRMALGTDLSLYFIDGGTRVRRITADGIVRTVAGNGIIGFSGDGGPATDAAINCSALAAQPNGGLYIADFGNHRMRRVGTDGIINTVADYTTQRASPVSVNLTPDGNLLIALTFTGARTPQIDLLKTDGSIATVAGGGSTAIGEGISATQANLVALRSVAVAPDGSILIAPGDNGSRLLRIGPSLPGFDGTESLIASEDGGTLYVFDASGRHLRTLKALTGATLYEFGYDSDGRLNRVTEKTGGTDNVSTIQHDSVGNPTAITGPFNQQTTLAVDANGFLASIRNPANEQMLFTYSGEGLLTSYTDPRGRTETYTYDASGRFIIESDAAGVRQTLARNDATNEVTVSRTTALVRTAIYKTENLPGNTQRRTVTEPDGTQSQSTETIDAATTHIMSADGTTADTTLSPDPRFGMESPGTASFSFRLPSGLELHIANTRAASLSNPLDPLSLSGQTDTITVDGRTSTTTYEAASRTYSGRSPAGRIRTRITDFFGRPVQSQEAGLNPMNYVYDNRGRLATVTRGIGPGSRTNSFTYDEKGFLETITDPIGRTVHFIRDAAGRPVSKTLPDGRIIGYGYDAEGNLTSLTPPARPSYRFAYSARNELTNVIPPSVVGTGPMAYTFDADGKRTTVSRPDNQTITIGYDNGGRPSTRALATGGVVTVTESQSYDTAGRVSSREVVGGVGLAYTYDGPLPTGETWSGSVVGSVTRTYDTSLRLASQSVDGANTIVFSYDDDSLLTGAGSLAITRDPQHGLPVASTLGVVRATTGYNNFGEPTNYLARASGGSIYSYGFARDGLGRISQKIETIGGVTDAYVYTYDLSGQLTSVVKNGSIVESYSYDDNGNRTNSTVGGLTVSSVYDDQDRLLQFSGTTIAYNAAGDLASKTTGGQTTHYQYDALGNLLGVTLPEATAITYIVDELGRRVGKKVNGVLVAGCLYGDSLRPVALLDGTGTLVSRFVYAGKNVPVSMTRGGAESRIITDHLGSVRLVVDSTTGAILQRLDYDSFGNVLLDTNPGFQPFGFAGGLYDSTTGLTRFGARDYDPTTGRWTTKDPIGFVGRDSNLYRYAQNNPMNLTDPTGTTDTSGLDQLSLENQTVVQDIIWEVGNDRGFQDQVNSILSGLPHAGSIRNGIIMVTLPLWGDDWASFVCNGISETAEQMVNGSNRNFRGLSSAESIERRTVPGRENEAYHTALELRFANGESVVLDWHETLSPFDPAIQTRQTF